MISAQSARIGAERNSKVWRPLRRPSSTMSNMPVHTSDPLKHTYVSDVPVIKFTLVQEEMTLFPADSIKS
jgi:hypothetical protein